MRGSLLPLFFFQAVFLVATRFAQLKTSLSESCICEMQIPQTLSFDIHTNCPGYPLPPPSREPTNKLRSKPQDRAKGLLAVGGDANGVVHIGVGFLAGIAVALITVFKIVQIALQDFHANPGEAFLAGIVQSVLGFQLVDGVGMFPELLDGVIGGPVSAVLALALFVQGVDQEIVGSQDEHDGRDPKNHEPLEHGAERTASAKSVLEDSRRAAQTRN